MPTSLPWIKDALEGLPKLLTVAEVADVLRCSARSVTRRIADGRLVALKSDGGSSGRVLIPRVELAKHLEGLGAP